MREYGPRLADLRRALGGGLVRSLSDEHLEAYKRAKLDGIDVGGKEPGAQARRRRSTSVWAWHAGSSRRRSDAV